METAQKYEALIDEVNAILVELNPIPKMGGCDWENGHGFVQQDKDAVISVRRQLLTIAARHIEHPWIVQSLENDSVDTSYAGRLISEFKFLTPLYQGWIRISNIDKQYREWGQAYFALHPEESPALKAIKSIENV